MRILVTVGTTPFEGLVKKTDSLVLKSDDYLMIQTGPTRYIPRNWEYKNFIANFLEYIENFDLIITHAGAGTVYSLLERGKKIIVVPNLERQDKHQLELAKYVHKNNYCSVVFDLHKLETILCDSLELEYNTYKNNSQILEDELYKIISS